MIILIDAEEFFENSTPLDDKTTTTTTTKKNLSRLRIVGNFLNMINSINKKPIANIIHNSKRLKCIP